MKNIFFFLLVGICCLTGCDKEDSLSQEEQLAVDTQIIEQYLADNNLIATKTASGLHYIINNPGVGPHPSLTSNVIVTYTGYLTNGDVFDKAELSNPLSENLSNLILGWQEGIQLMKKEGKATLFIPSYLGYGDADHSLIPANSVLIFEITLLDF